MISLPFCLVWFFMRSFDHAIHLIKRIFIHVPTTFVIQISAYSVFFVIYIEYFPYCVFASKSQVIGCEDHHLELSLFQPKWPIMCRVGRKTLHTHTPSKSGHCRGTTTRIWHLLYPVLCLCFCMLWVYGIYNGDIIGSLLVYLLYASVIIVELKWVSLYVLTNCKCQFVFDCWSVSL